MTWHLKDRDLERKLVELYPSFLDDLKFGVMHKWNRHCVHVECTRVRGNGSIPNDTVSFWDDELEEVHEYNPRAWNKYPAVKPPEGVPMRVETNMGFGFKATFEHGDWLDNRNDIVGFGDGDVVRFRPWSDD